MLLYLFMCKLYIFSLLHGFSSATGEVYCTKADRITRPDCTILKHCNYDYTGSCIGPCDDGWMGKECQYVDLANNNQSIKSNVQKTEFDFDLKQKFIISALLLEINSLSLSGVKATITGQDNFICYDNKQLSLDIRSVNIIEIFCDRIGLSSTLHMVFTHEVSVKKLKVYGGRNVALRKDAQQSSTYIPDYSAERAVDGWDGGGAMSSFSCTHTADKTGQPWWTVSLGNVFAIMSVRIANRATLGHRLKGFRMYFIKGQTRTLLYTDHSHKIGREVWINSSDMHHYTTEKVLIESIGNVEPETENILTLCEVELFACRPLYDGSEDCSGFCPSNCKQGNTCLNSGFQCPDCANGWTGPYCTMCALPPLPQNMHSERDTYQYGEKITFKCDHGYQVSGIATMTCGIDYRLENVPVCQGVSCQGLDLTNAKSIPNPHVYTHPHSYKIVCNEGYETADETVLGCKADGSWSSSVPNCTAVRCPSLKLRNADVEYNIPFYKYEDRVKISCNAGYTTSDNTDMICGSNGTWNNPEPVCTGVRCPDLNLTHAVADRDRNEYIHPNTITVSCKDGYTTSDIKKLFCNTDGQWDNLEPTCTESDTPDPEKKSSGTVVIAGSSAAGAALVVVILIIVVFFVRRKSPVEKKYEENHSLQQTEHQYTQVSKPKKKNETVPSTLSSNETNAYYNIANVDVGKAKVAKQEVYYEFTEAKKPSPTSVHVKDFKAYVDLKKRDRQFLQNQFKKLFTGLQFPTKDGLIPENRVKNKYKNIYPYDDSRVKLNKEDSEGGTDYINASFIHGYGQVKSYIASQGPLKDTLNDFWHMVWQERCGKIVMLTNVMEDGKEKCTQYWPDTDQMQLGSLELELLDTETFADFTIRTLMLKNKKDSHMVKQFHFTAWPDKGVPLYTSSLVHFRSKVLHAKSRGHGPTVVHCSAGVGRTGTYIGLDYLVKQGDDTKFVDVFGCVETLRRQRVNMVQTLEQYVFLHIALLEALMCVSFDPSAAEFPEMYKELLKIDSKLNKQKILIQYEDLCSSSPEIPESEFSAGKMAKNRGKNRYNDILPVDREIPRLIFLKNDECYINAVFLPAYKHRSSFVVTQMPMKNTVIDFWRLLYTHKVSTVVMLNDVSSDGGDIGIYWPSGDSETVVFEPFTITKESHLQEHKGYNVTILSYKYKDKEERRVSIYCQTFWSDGKYVPSSVPLFLELVNAVGLHQERHNTGPMVVHCMNGTDKSGLFCVLQVVLERMKIEHDVAISQIIKQMRSVRPQIITNVDQFKFCHEAVMEFLTQNETYSNFQ